MTWTLITIPASHYCDKARWALDRAGIAYREDGHMPILHWPAARRQRGTRTVPILVHDQGVATDSTDILRLIDAQLPAAQRLFPDEPVLVARVAEWEERFDRQLGPAARRVVYFHLLAHSALAVEVVGTGTPRAERLLFRALFPVLAGMMRRGMNITPKKAAESRAKLQALFTDVGAELADGRPYLCGDRLTAADVTFAALASPVLLPDDHPVLQTPWARVPAALQAEVEAFRQTPAGQFGLRLYREDRQRQAVTAQRA